MKTKKYTELDYIKIPWKTCPLLISILFTLQLSIAFIPSLQILATSYFVNTAIDAITHGTRNQVIIPLILIMLVISYNWLYGSFLSLLNQKISMRMRESFQPKIIEKRSKLEYKHVEDAEKWELIFRTSSDMDQRILSGMMTVVETIQLVIRITSVLIILSTQVWWAALLIIIFSVPLFVISMKSGQKKYEVSKAASQYTRKAQYLQGIITDRSYIEERATYGYTDNLNARWFEKYEQARKMNLRITTKNFIMAKLASLITLAVSLIISLVLIFPLKNNLLSIGMFMALINATFELVQMMSWNLSSITHQIANNHEYLKNLTLVMSLDEKENANDLPNRTANTKEIGSIEFRDVSFKYPGTDRYVLKHLSFKLYDHKNYAFVGSNGAGKSTIIKLLTGLYSDYEGEILVNDKNIKEYTFDVLKGFYACVYQDFVKYNITLKENIGVGNINEVSNERIVQCLNDVGLSDLVKTLPKGTNTPLGKAQTDGVDVSGGQWQRIALARALSSDAPITILDEPTAAIDPIAERNIYNLFKQVSNDKLKIVITHRLGAAILADNILVLSDGNIYEQGTHESLLNNNGIYAEMFESQRSWYQ